jgi:hypothetical protein
VKKYRVWARSCGPKSGAEEILELPDDATEEEIFEACHACLEAMIENELESGWEEVAP